MLWAAEVVSQDVGVWVVGVVLTAIVSALGFLVRNSFDGVQKSIEGLGAKMDDMRTAIAQGDGDRRELAADVRALRERIERLERSLEQLSEGHGR